MRETRGIRCTPATEAGDPACRRGKCPCRSRDRSVGGRGRYGSSSRHRVRRRHEGRADPWWHDNSRTRGVCRAPSGRAVNGTTGIRLEADRAVHRFYPHGRSSTRPQKCARRCVRRDNSRTSCVRPARFSPPSHGRSRKGEPPQVGGRLCHGRWSTRRGPRSSRSTSFPCHGKSRKAWGSRRRARRGSSCRRAPPREPRSRARQCLEWQPVQGCTSANVSPACGLWQSTHLPGCSACTLE